MAGLIIRLRLLWSVVATENILMMDLHLPCTNHCLSYVKCFNKLLTFVCRQQKNKINTSAVASKVKGIA